MSRIIIRECSGGSFHTGLIVLGCRLFQASSLGNELKVSGVTQTFQNPLIKDIP